MGINNFKRGWKKEEKYLYTKIRKISVQIIHNILKFFIILIMNRSKWRWRCRFRSSCRKVEGCCKKKIINKIFKVYPIFSYGID